MVDVSSHALAQRLRSMMLTQERSLMESMCRSRKWMIFALLRGRPGLSKQLNGAAISMVIRLLLRTEVSQIHHSKSVTPSFRTRHAGTHHNKHGNRFMLDLTLASSLSSKGRLPSTDRCLGQIPTSTSAYRQHSPACRTQTRSLGSRAIRYTPPYGIYALYGTYAPYDASLVCLAIMPV